MSQAVRSTGMRPVGTPEELERRRRRAVELVKQGEKPALVARILGVGRSSIYTWLKLDRQAPEALAAKAHPGPKPRLTDEQIEELEGLLLKGEGPRLAQRPLDGPPGRRGHPPPLRR